jgi:hypothetical protein
MGQMCKWNGRNGRFPLNVSRVWNKIYIGVVLLICFVLFSLLRYRDAWHAQRNQSRTEAKRQYISTLIATMHKYASPTPEAGELVSELEFVWDQIKSNPSSNSSSPKQPMGLSHQVHSQASYPSLGGGRTSRGYSNELGDRGRDSRLRVLSPVSQADEEFGRRHPAEREDEDENEEEEYQEARDEPYTEDENEDEIYDQHHALREGAEPRPGRRRGDHHNSNYNNNGKWRRRVEQALTKMSTEVAALREQLEARAMYNRQRSSPWAWLKWIAWVSFKQILCDFAILGVILLVMRLRGDRRLEERLKRLWRETRMKKARVKFLRRLQLLPTLS